MRLGAIAAVAGALALAACSPGEQPDTPPNDDPACQIEEAGEPSPGFPYDIQAYNTQVLPALVADCSAQGCHGAPAGNGGLIVWADSALGNCNYAKTFKSMKTKIDLTNPEESRLLVAINNRAAHPPYLNTYNLLVPFVAAAAEKAGQEPLDPNANPFNIITFKDVIQPIIDSAGGSGCSTVGCHADNAGLFDLVPNPTSDADILGNFTAVIARMDINNPSASIFLAKAQTLHGGGISTIVDATQAAAILAWGEDAKINNGDNPTPAGCIPPDSFNFGVFRDEIEPILFGLVDGVQSCAGAACHGVERGGGAFVLRAGQTEANLASFGCFIDLNQPVRSEILDCPTDGGLSCRRDPHPGEDIFEDGQDDINYQRILSYLYATKTSVVPIDFAFYARVINPMLNDPASVQDGVPNLTCADSECHGVNGPNQLPPNGSNFPIIANLADKNSLLFNYSSALNFVNFIQPEGSSLFLYPTNEIANLENPFATGLPHPGGLDFDVDDQEALDILEWARGLRLDADGFVQHWLVGGDYTGATSITSPTPLNNQESTMTPAIFDQTLSSQFNQGQWDFLRAGDNGLVDLGAEFLRNVNPGRSAYAVAYVINQTGRDIQARFTIVSDGGVRVYVGEALVEEANNASAGQTGIVNLPSSLGGGSATRILVKVFQPVNVDDFAFSFQLTDEDDLPLDEDDVIIMLSPNGGI